jgi:hypothetical protein
MTDQQSRPGPEPDDAQPATRLPKRDYILLPLLALATALFMFGASEVLTRLIWAEQEKDSCAVEDPIAGNHFKANCTARTKNAEGPWATYRRNECGYLSQTSCGTKPQGAIRIAIVGSSLSEALHIPYEQSYFALAAQELGRVSHRTIDVQNLAVPASGPVDSYRQIPAALALKPDVVVYLISPIELMTNFDQKQVSERNNPRPIDSTTEKHLPGGAMRKLQSFLTGSRTIVVAQHFLFQDKDAYLRLYLLYGDKGDFLRQPLTPAWQQRFTDIDLIIGDMADKLRAAGVPFVVVAIPSRAEAALLSSRNLPAHVDPFAFGRQIQAVAAKHGAGYVDVMDAFSRIPKAESLYYAVDGHPAAGAQKVIADNLSRKLEDGTIPALSRPATQPAQVRER